MLRASYLLTALGLIFSLPCDGRSLNEKHYFDAPEWNVESPERVCATTQGLFGRSAKYESFITYQYELTLTNENCLQDAVAGIESRTTGTEGIGMQGIVSAIENGIGDYLLESQVFDSVCSGGVARGPYQPEAPYQRGDDRRLRSPKRQMRAVGISSQPEDQILEGLTCRVFVDETDGPCMVVDGEFVIYLDIYEDLDDVLSSMLTTLMNTEHQLDRAHPCVMKVRYIDLSADTISGNAGGGDEQVPQGTNTSTLSSSFYALLAAGAFVVVGTAVFYRRRRRVAEHDGETSAGAQSAAHLEASSLQ